MNTLFLLALLSQPSPSGGEIFEPTHPAATALHLNDNICLYLGTGDDATFCFDATDLVLTQASGLFRLAVTSGADMVGHPLYLSNAADPDTHLQWTSADKATLTLGNVGLYFAEATDITVGTTSGDLILAPAGGDVSVSGRLTNLSAALNLGTAAATGHSLASGDVLVGGKLEVDGVSYFDSDVTIASTRLLAFGGTTTGVIQGSAVQTPDTIAIWTGALANSLLIGQYVDRSTDFAHAQQANPTLFIQSADATTIADWVSMAHDQTNGVIATGTGALSLQSFDKSIQLPVLDAAAPAEPVACAAGTVGRLVYVNDNNDGAAAELCICAGITNDATYDWVQVKDMTTACTFF